MLYDYEKTITVYYGENSRKYHANEDCQYMYDKKYEHTLYDALHTDIKDACGICGAMTEKEAEECLKNTDVNADMVSGLYVIKPCNLRNGLEITYEIIGGLSEGDIITDFKLYDDNWYEVIIQGEKSYMSTSAAKVINVNLNNR